MSELKTLVVGMLGVNCYIVSDGEAGLIIDPGGNAEGIIDCVKGLKDVTIVLTHGHADHIGALDDVRQKTGGKVYIHKDDAPMLGEPELNLSAFMGYPVKAAPPEGFLADGDTVTVGSLKFTVLHTPGHSPGGICLYGNGWLFSGDTLFAGSVGRTDFPGSSIAALMASVREKILPIEGDVILFPGHGPTSTLADERRQNPFL